MRLVRHGVRTQEMWLSGFLISMFLSKPDRTASGKAQSHGNWGWKQGEEPTGPGQSSKIPGQAMDRGCPGKRTEVTRGGRSRRSHCLHGNRGSGNLCSLLKKEPPCFQTHHHLHSPPQGHRDYPLKREHWSRVTHLPKNVSTNHMTGGLDLSVLHPVFQEAKGAGS